ncbi:methyl-accepting chemotaxis protein [Bacillus sp. 1P06AnD]
MKRKSLKKSIILLLFSLICIMLLFNIGIIYFNSSKSIIGTYKETGEMNASRIASQINPSDYQEFLNNPENGNYYDSLIRKLNDIRKKAGYLYVYTMGADGEKLKIMVDGQDNPVDIGSAVTATQYSDVESVLKGKTNSSDIVNDPEFGDYLSSFAPIKNESGEVIGILGIEMDATAVKRVQNDVLKSTLPFIIAIAVIVTGLLLGIVYMYLGKKLNPLKRLTKVAQFITEGEVEKAKTQINEQNVTSNNEIGQLYKSIKEMTNTLELLITKMLGVSRSLNERSVQLNETSKEVSEGANQVATTMEEMALGSESQAHLATSLNEHMQEYSTLNQLTTMQGNEIARATSQVLEESKNGANLMNDSRGKMEEIYTIINESVDQITVLNEQNQKVSSLVSLISGIADQTNLLSLNAAIEAARAGEHGKGFAVVAEEVRKLSNEVSNSVNGIHSIVDEVTNNSVKMVDILERGLEKVENGRTNLIQTGETFNTISTSISSMNELAIAMSEQLSAVSAKEEEITASVEEVASISQENAAGIEEVSASGEEISASMEALSQLVEDLHETSKELIDIGNQFKVQ